MDILALAQSAVAEDTYEQVIPPAVDGRHLQLDADVCAYFCDVDKSVAHNFNELKKYIETQRLMAGAELVNLHLTMGEKGGREAVAMVQEYQASRQTRDENKQILVKELRVQMSSYSTDTVVPVAWFDREADDGMTQYQNARIETHGLESSVIMTVDKDLDMSHGNHMHPKTYNEYYVPNGYGEIWLDESTSQKKIVGRGTAFLWAQMLAGDSADYIPGLPKISAAYLNKHFPTKAILNAKTIKSKKAAMAKRKEASCGYVTAYDILRNCTSDREAYDKVREAYESYYGKRTFDYVCWRGNEHKLTAGHMMLEQARLLWMQRTPGEDVLVFFKEVADGLRD